MPRPTEPMVTPIVTENPDPRRSDAAPPRWYSVPVSRELVEASQDWRPMSALADEFRIEPSPDGTATMLLRRVEGPSEASTKAQVTIYVDTAVLRRETPAMQRVRVHQEFEAAKATLWELIREQWAKADGP